MHPIAKSRIEVKQAVRALRSGVFARPSGRWFAAPAGPENGREGGIRVTGCAFWRVARCTLALPNDGFILNILARTETAYCFSQSSVA